MTGPTNPDTGQANPNTSGNPPGPGPYQPIEQQTTVASALNLRPFQYQIGGLVFGRHTNMVVSKVDIQTYNVNAEDFQIIRTNERSFGVDTLSPGSLVFTLGALDNRPINFAAAIDYDLLPLMLGYKSQAMLSDFLMEWKANDVFPNWGETKPIYFADRDGVTKRIYGRPGKVTYSRSTTKNAFWNVQAEYRRADTYVYSDVEYFVGPIYPGQAPVFASRQDGDGPAWMRILFTGPFNHPVMTYGENVLEVGVQEADGSVLEVNSYPWERRVIDSNGINWRSQLLGETVYLDQLQFPVGTTWPISWVQEGTANSDTAAYFCWRESYNMM
jgi:hypothetical protein